MELKDRFKKVLNKFVEIEKQEQRVIGIFVTGSYVFDELFPNSDLDLFIVTNEKHMQIVGKVMDGIELECCYKPLEQYFYDINIAKHPLDIQRYSHGEILFDPAGEVQRIIAESNEIFFQGPNYEITDADLYHLKNKFLDLKDRMNTHYARILLIHAFEQLIKIYFKKENLWECKISYLIPYLKSHDSSFGRLIEGFLSEQNIVHQHQRLLILKDIVLGGVRELDENWKTGRIVAPVFRENSMLD